MDPIIKMKYYLSLKFALSVAIPLSVLISCPQVKERKDSTEVLGFDSKVTLYPKVVRGYDIIPLEQTEDCILTGIRKIAIVDSSYVIFDNYNSLIVRYDAKGKFLNRIGNKGRASSEYLRIDAFAVDEEGHILIFDGSLDRILVYEPDGRYISSIAFQRRSLGFINDVACLGKGEFIVNNCVYNDYNDIYRMLSIKDKKFSHLAGFPMLSEDIVEPTGRATISSYGRILFLKPFDDTLYSINERGQVSPVLHVRHAAKSIDDKYYENHVNFSVATTYTEVSKNGYFTGFVSVFETNLYILLNTFDDIYFLVDKDTYSGRALQLFSCEDYGGVPLMNVAASFSGGFVGYWRPGDISDESILELIDNSANESVKGFASTLKEQPEDGNPCLIVYHME